MRDGKTGGRRLGLGRLSAGGNAAMRVLAVLALNLGVVASFAADAETSRSEVQSKELALATLAADADPATDPIATLWKDRLPALRAHVASKAPKFLDATFIDGDKSIVFSVSINDPNCENLSGALGRASAFSSCPMRVAVAQNGTVQMVKSEPTFYYPDPRYAQSMSKPLASDATTVTFNPHTRELSYQEIVDGEPDQAAPDASAFKITY